MTGPQPEAAALHAAVVAAIEAERAAASAVGCDVTDGDLARAVLRSPAFAEALSAPVPPGAVPVAGDSGQVSPASHGQSGEGTSPVPADPREPLGRIVHEQRVALDAEIAATEGRERFRLGDWGDRTAQQRELDMRIGEAIAAEVRKRFEDRITFLEGLAEAAGQAAAGYPEHSPAWTDMTARAEAYAKAAEIARGVTGGEGWGEP